MLQYKIQIVKQTMVTEHVLVAVHTTFYIVAIVRQQEKIHFAQSLIRKIHVHNVIQAMNWM